MTSLNQKIEIIAHPKSDKLMSSHDSTVKAGNLSNGPDSILCRPSIGYIVLLLAKINPEETFIIALRKLRLN